MEQDFSKYEYGWLSPSGNWIEVEWAQHESVAMDFVKKLGYEEEYEEWRDKQSYNAHAGDFLMEVKGWVIISAPALDHYFYTNAKPLTKQQRDFLYAYYCAKSAFYRPIAENLLREND